MNPKVSPIGKWQVYILTVMSLFNVRFLFVSSLYADTLEQNAWVAMALAGVIAMIGGAAYFTLSSRFPNYNVYQYAQKLYGKYLGAFVVLIIYMYLQVSLGFSTRAFAEGIRAFLLDTTPLLVVMFSFLFVALYLANCGLFTIVKLTEFIFPLFLFGMLAIIFVPFRQIDITNLLPILPEGPGVLISGLPLIVQSYVGFGLIGFLIYRAKDKQVAIPIMAGILTVIVLKTLVTITFTAFFGIEEIKHVLYPPLEMAKGLELPGNILERTETFFMLTWIPISFLSMATFFYMASKAITFLIPKCKMRYSTIIVLVVCLIIARYPSSVEQNLEYIKYVEAFGAFLSFVFTPFSWLVARLKGGK